MRKRSTNARHVVMVGDSWRREIPLIEEFSLTPEFKAQKKWTTWDGRVLKAPLKLWLKARGIKYDWTTHGLALEEVLARKGLR